MNKETRKMFDWLWDTSARELEDADQISTYHETIENMTAEEILKEYETRKEVGF